MFVYTGLEKNVSCCGIAAFPCLQASKIQPGSSRPLRTVCASFPACGSVAFEALPAKGKPGCCYSFLLPQM